MPVPYVKTEINEEIMKKKLWMQKFKIKKLRVIGNKSFNRTEAVQKIITNQKLQEGPIIF